MTNPHPPAADAAQALEGVTDIEELAYRFWSTHPKDIPEPVGMPEGYKGGARAWFYATEMRAALSEQNATLAAQVAELTYAEWERSEHNDREDSTICLLEADLGRALRRAEAAEAKVARLEEESESWKRAFAAQSNKLQKVLFIPGVRAALTEGTPE